VACCQHDRSHSAAPRGRAATTATSIQRAVCRAALGVRRTKRDLVCRFQRPLSGRRPSVLSADDHGRLQPVPAAVPRPAAPSVGARPDGLRGGLSRVWLAADHPHRQRRAFSTLAAGSLSRLPVWWIRLGIRPERILPGRPDQNGRHERLHRTLKAETARPPRGSFRAQRRCFDRFRQEYNHDRPHEALRDETPASHYQPSGRAYPARLPPIEYPSYLPSSASIRTASSLSTRRSGTSPTVSTANSWGWSRWTTTAGPCTLARSSSGCWMGATRRGDGGAISVPSCGLTAPSRGENGGPIGANKVLPMSSV
jgi:hypothetical protein